MPNPVLQRLVNERTQTNENIDKLLDLANDEERDPTDSERELITRYKTRLTELEPQIVELLDLEETRDKAKDARAMLNRSTTRAPEGDDSDDGDPPGQRVVSDDKATDDYPTFARYARDVIITRFSNIGSQLPRHTRQQAAERLQRAVDKVLVADVEGIVPTQYITQIMQVIDAGRPLVDAANRITLQSGKIQFPVITDRPEAARQTAEKTEAGDGSMAVGIEDQLADTYLVAANFSWQVVNWSNPDALRLWFDLAASSYAQKTDAAAGAALSAASTTPIPVASDDLAGWMAALAAAAGEVYANTGRFANIVVANPADAFKLVGMVSEVSPVFLTTGQANLATGQFPALAGLRFVASAGVPAGEAYVGDSRMLLVAETAGSPVELRAVEPSIGGLEVGIIGAFAAAITDEGAFAEITPPTP